MSETTKRIEDLLRYKFPQLGDINREIANYLATHLHQEVIRGKIEERRMMKSLMDYTGDEMAWVEANEDRIAELEKELK